MRARICRSGRSRSASWIGEHGGQLVYGGGSNGLMGVVADATLGPAAGWSASSPRRWSKRNGPTRLHRAARRGHHARAQTHDGRARRRLPGAARRHRHASRSFSRSGPGASSATTTSRSACSTWPATTTTCLPSCAPACEQRFMSDWQMDADPRRHRARACCSCWCRSLAPRHATGFAARSEPSAVSRPREEPHA